MSNRILHALFFAAVLAGPLSASSFFFIVDTSSISGTYGYIDLQFDPGDATSQAATANVLNFKPGDAALDSTNIQISGDFTGTLPATLTADNGTAYNDYYEGMTFGSLLTFELTLSGPAITMPDGLATSGSTFGVGFYDNNQNSILTNDPSGFAGEVNINLDGTTSPQVFQSAFGGPSVVSIQTVPEPSTFWLAGIILLLLMTFQMGRQKAI